MSRTRRVATASEAETRALAARLAPHLGAGSLIGLTGDLGAGKTVFVQGLAAGLPGGERVRVRSPSYVIVEEHPTEPRLVHADLYRLAGGAAELEGIGFEEIVEAVDAIVAVEWFERAGELALPPALRVELAIGEGDRRELTLTAEDARYHDALAAAAG